MSNPLDYGLPHFEPPPDNGGMDYDGAAQQHILEEWNSQHVANCAPFSPPTLSTYNSPYPRYNSPYPPQSSNSVPSASRSAAEQSQPKVRNVHDANHPYTSLEPDHEPVGLEAGWRLFISWLVLDAQTPEVYRLAREQSVVGVRPQIWLDGWLGRYLESEPMMGNALHGINLSPGWVDALTAGSETYAVLDRMRDIRVATKDYAELLNGIASSQPPEVGMAWVANLVKNRMPTWLMVIEDGDVMTGISLTEQLVTWEFVPTTTNIMDWRCALHALAYSYNSFLDQQAKHAGVSPNPALHTNPNTLINLLFTSIKPNNIARSTPTPAYDAIITIDLQKNKALKRNDFLTSNDFSEDQIRDCLELLDPNFRLGIIDKGADGTRRPIASLMRPPSSNLKAGNIIWVVNDGYGTRGHVVNPQQLAFGQAVGHWEGMGKSGDAVGTKTVRSWNYPRPAGGGGEHPRGKGNSFRGFAVFGGGEDDKGQGDDGDDDGGGKNGKRKKDGTLKKKTSRSRPCENRYGLGRGRGERPWPGNGQWYHYPQWWGEFIDDGKRKPHEIKRFTYEYRLRRARHNMAIEKRPPPLDKTLEEIEREIYEHRKKIDLHDPIHDPAYTAGWRRRQYHRRERNRRNRIAAAQARASIYAEQGFDHAAFGDYVDPAYDGESDDDELYDLYEAVEGPIYELKGNEILDPNRMSERYECAPCRSKPAKAKFCDFRRRRFPCTPCANANRKNDCVEAGSLPQGKKGPRDPRGPYFQSFCDTLAAIASQAQLEQRQNNIKPPKGAGGGYVPPPRTVYASPSAPGSSGGQVTPQEPPEPITTQPIPSGYLRRHPPGTGVSQQTQANGGHSGKLSPGSEPGLGAFSLAEIHGRAQDHTNRESSALHTNNTSSFSRPHSPPLAAPEIPEPIERLSDTRKRRRDVDEDPQEFARKKQAGVNAFDRTLKPLTRQTGGMAGAAVPLLLDPALRDDGETLRGDEDTFVMDTGMPGVRSTLTDKFL